VLKKHQGFLGSVGEMSKDIGNFLNYYYYYYYFPSKEGGWKNTKGWQEDIGQHQGDVGGCRSTLRNYWKAQSKAIRECLTTSGKLWGMMGKCQEVTRVSKNVKKMSNRLEEAMMDIR